MRRPYRRPDPWLLNRLPVGLHDGAREPVVHLGVESIVLGEPGDLGPLGSLVGVPLRQRHAVLERATPGHRDPAQLAIVDDERSRH